ncbi:4716_t:CDS:2 [Rhizophagus irregularis]|nr:4716_t:CDS:2 [Rhizophagus irregularis]
MKPYSNGIIGELNKLNFFNPSGGLFNTELYKICNDKGTRNDGRSVGEVLFKHKKRKRQILSSASDEEGLRHKK